MSTVINKTVTLEVMHQQQPCAISWIRLRGRAIGSRWQPSKV